MKTMVKQPNPDPPYSLHDAYISQLQAEGDILRLITQCGYVCTTPPCNQVEGDVEITGIDWDFSCVYVMEYQGVLCGNYGSFTGRKMTVADFVGERCLEFQLDICYAGEFRYLLKE